MNQEFRQIIAELKKPFPPEAHVERPLPGGGRWLYIKWQDIRERLDEVYPEWSCTWGEITYVGEFCVTTCTITIADVSRQAPGNAPLTTKSIGTPIERAVADAFKNAAEAFGVGRYLDDQKFTANYLSQKGDMRAYKFAKENEQIEAGARGRTNAPVQAEPKQQTRLQAAGASLNTKPVIKPVTKQNERVKAVCEQINYPIELAREWLNKCGKSSFDKLSQESVDKFVGDICRMWATQNGMNEHHAKNSYKKRVLSPSANTMKSEIELIADWMSYVGSIKLDEKDLVEAP